MRLAPLALAATGSVAAAAPDVELYKNDSLPDSGKGVAACQAGFVTNEIGAAVFAVPAEDGRVLLLDLQFLACDGSGLGLAQPRPVQVLVYPAGGPDPGTPEYTSPSLSAVPGFVNVWGVVEQGLEYGAGETFTVGVKLLAGGLFGSFTTLATDADGCQPGKSLIFAVPGGWTDACSLGVSGDMVVRARVLTNGPVAYGAPTPGTGGLAPALDSTGPWYVGSSDFALEATDVLPSAPGALALSTAPATLPALGGLLHVDPATAVFLPTAADGSGTATAAAPIPSDRAFVGVHVFAQAGFLDAGAAGSVSLTNGLDVRISSQ